MFALFRWCGRQAAPGRTAVAVLLAGCAGIYQRPAPAVPDTWERVAVAEDLRVGAAEADVTPADGQYLAGFDLARGSTGVHSRLRARALVLIAGGSRTAIVGIDNLGLMRDDVDWIKAGIEGFANGAVFLCSSHTHAAPDLVGLWGPYLLASGRDRSYLAALAAGVRRAVAEAAARARPAKLVRGEARLPPAGLVRNSNRAGLFDPRVTVVQARDARDDEPIAALIHLACHPEVLRRRNTEISADFVGALCARWQRAGHGQPVFVNGALGAMVTPEPDGEAGVATMAEGLFAVAEAALAAAEPLAVGEIEVRRRDVYMPITSPFLILGRLTLAIARSSYGGLLRTTVGYLRVGSLEAACVPGEMEPALAERLRRTALRPRLLVFGLADDELGYLMRARDAHDPLFAYERGMSPVVDAGERIHRALAGR